MNEDLIIKVADKIIESSKTYGEALQLCKRVEREIVAKNAVNAVEQITDEYTDSEQKLTAAKTKVKKALEQYNIYLTDSQLEMFIESAVKEMNDNWKGENK